MKFVDEGVRLRAMPKAPKKNPKSQAVPTLSPSCVHPDNSAMERDQVVASFVQDLFPLSTGPLRQSYIGGWLWLVPTVLRQQLSLDLAAESLALVYFAKKTGSSDALMRSYTAYSSALANVSRALQHPERRLSSETLCATLLLVHYEVCIQHG